MTRRRALESFVVSGVLTSVVVAMLVTTMASEARGAAAKQKPVIGQLVLEGGAPAPITGFSWGVTADSSWTKGGGASVGKPNPGSIRLTKEIDPSSIAAFRKITAGQAFATAVFTLSFGKGANVSTMVYEMEGLFVTGVTQSAAEGVTTEDLELVFKAVKWTFTDSSGGVTTGRWDVPSGSIS